MYKSGFRIKMFPKKSQRSIGAPQLIIAIVVLVILYILFLPPQDRAELLGDQTTTVTTSGTASSSSPKLVQGRETLLLETPGKIDYSALNELEIPLNAFTLYKTVNAQVLEEFNPIYVKNGVGDKSSKNISFELANLENLDNLQLSFTAKKHSGVLSIRLNGNSIYEFDLETSTPQPIKLKKNMLAKENSIEFSVSNVGWKFWITNEYSLEDIKIIGEVTDTSRQESFNTFYLSEKQGKNLENARLEFNPECKSNDVGKLNINLNDRTIFSAIPDCGSLNFVDFAPNMVFVGKNKIDFSTEKGSYLIDLIKVELDFEDNQIPVYYFDIGIEFFNLKYSIPDDAECGTIDSTCPDQCNEDNDYDCCMTQYTTPFWCVANTDNEDDRCIGFVTADNAGRCLTNYVDRSKKVSDAGKNKCGDNTDGKCPSGCSINYDKDCCFDQDNGQFWCDMMPTNGLSYRCVNSVSMGQCDICPVGYKGEKTSPICQPVMNGLESEELKSEYNVILNMKFIDDIDRKEADIYINGHVTRLDTQKASYQRDISEFIEPGSNSIEIVPYSVLNIREVKVDVIQ